MSKKLFVFVSVLILASMALAACQPAAPQTVVQTQIVEGESVVVTATPEPCKNDGMGS